MQTMLQRYRRPDWVRRINAMAKAVGGAKRLIRIDADEMLEQAAESIGGLPTGDFGDPDWRVHLDRLVAGVNAADLHVVGRLLTKEELLRCVRTRLLLNRTLEEQPSIESDPIEAPLVVTGPARSGTTILFELLALDPDLRSPLAWEALHPVANESSAESSAESNASRDWRLAASECEQELWADVQPEFAAIHELRSDLPVECVTLTAACFCGPHWSMIGQLPGFELDYEVVYDFHRRVLQVLQASGPRPTWLLKTPAHLLTLDLLFETYPDAWVIQTHRDPAKTMPSTVSTTAMAQWMRTDHVDLEVIKTMVEAAFGFSLNNVAERRREGSLPPRFADVHFKDLVGKPVDAIRRAYDSMERPFREEHGERIERYLAEKPRGKFGKHAYTPEEWGFTAEGLRNHLATYIDYFSVEAE